MNSSSYKLRPWAEKTWRTLVDWLAVPTVAVNLAAVYLLFTAPEFGFAGFAVTVIASPVIAAALSIAVGVGVLIVFSPILIPLALFHIAKLLLFEER